MQGDLTASVAEFRAFVAEAEAAHDPIWKVTGLQGLGFALAYQGEATAARAAAEAAIEVAAEFGEDVLGLGFSALGERPSPPATPPRPKTQSRRHGSISASAGNRNNHLRPQCRSRTGRR